MAAQRLDMIVNRQNFFRSEHQMRTRQTGMTLMELLVVIAILAVIASIAIPSYRRYLIRAQRSDATIALLRLQSAQEKHFLQYGSYVIVKANLPKSHADGGLGIPVKSERGFYDLDVEDTDTGYTAVATPVAGGGQADDHQCVEFSVTESGVKLALDNKKADQTVACFR
jgi:type IV pilus assembly protein PilE